MIGLIYIKEGDTYHTYHISDDGRLISTSADGAESILLYDMSPEFDGIITEDKIVHLVLQGVNGELIYLKKEQGTWRKYSIIKSKKGIQKISNLRLICHGATLCVFYVMSHKGKNLVVKHIFSEDDMHIEPEVLGLCDSIRSFDICTDKEKQTSIIFKNPFGEHYRIIINKEFIKLKEEKLPAEDEVLGISTIYFKNELYIAYTSPRKNSTALVVCSEKNMFRGKIVTFGIARNCTPHIIFNKEKLVVQWEENGVIMQSESKDLAENFSKPLSLGGECNFSKIRHAYDAKEPDCNICAAYNGKPYFSHQKSFVQNNLKVEKKEMPESGYIKNQIVPEIDTEKILTKLEEIKKDILKMSLSLTDINTVLDSLKNQKSTKPDTYKLTEPKYTNQGLSGDDIGEIDEENIKLFERTDIGTVLPDKTGDMEVMQ